MKVLDKQNRTFSRSRIGRFFKEHKWITRILVTLSSFLAIVLLLYSTFDYGGKLFLQGHTRYYNQLIKDVTNMDFAFVKNFAAGKMASLDDVRIDIKFKHLMRIDYLRDRAMKEKYIPKEFKNEEFPATLTYNGKPHNVRISLTGRVSKIHLGNPTKWSFQVKVRGDDTVQGMKRFGMLMPAARGHLTDWLSFEMMKDEEMIGMRVDFVDVSVNGKQMGIYYLEERFDKYLIENNLLREGIIFKLENDVIPYQEAKLKLSPKFNSQLNMLRQMWQDVSAGTLPPEHFFDLEKLAKLFVITDLFGTQHPLNKENLRFYFNPVTGLAEPIAREFMDVGRTDPNELITFLENPPAYTSHYWHKKEAIINRIYDNDKFKRLYIQQAERMSNPEYLDKFFAKRQDKIDDIRSKLYSTFPYFKLPTKALYGNQKKLREIIYQDKVELAADLLEISENSILVEFTNLQDLPLEIKHLSLNDVNKIVPQEPIILENNTEERSSKKSKYSFQIPDYEKDIWKESDKIKVHYSLFGLDNNLKTIQLNTSEKDLEEIIVPDPAISTIDQFEFIDQNQNDVYKIPAGEWQINSDLIIPENKSLIIQAGANLNIGNQASIISSSPVFFMGNESQPILVSSTDGTGKGLFVYNCQNASEILYTRFELAADKFKEAKSTSTGIAQFYRSPVNIVESSFVSSSENSPALQLIQTEVAIHSSKFNNSGSDAIFCDQCTGEIQSSSFLKIGNNAIAMSGGELKIHNALMLDIENAALDLTEDSRLDAKWIKINGAKIGINGKDRSRITASDVKINNNKVGIAVYQFMPNRGPAYARLSKISVENSEMPFLQEADSELIVNGEAIKENLTDVQSLLQD